MVKISHLALIIALAFSISAVSLSFAEKPAAPAPDFTLTDIAGKKTSLAEFRGKVVLLNFWATWCGPCRAEMPSLNKLYLDLRDRGFVVLAVSIDTSDKPVKSFVAEKRLAFPVLMDKDKEVSFDLYGAMGMPTSFLIDKNGVITEKIMGEMEWDSPKMKEKILKLLGGKK